MGSRSEPVRSRRRDTLVRLRTYAAALGLVAAALLLRQALDPLLGDLYPFATTFLAVLAAATFFGLGPVCWRRWSAPPPSPKPFSTAALARKVREVLDAPGATT